ncbi:MAG TPA: hypothetical protein PK468_26130 [Candidatus Hydrogenedentes bacterium]|nr:hypothetical protein [Candidatus Hydrogenedentota bacterium]
MPDTSLGVKTHAGRYGIVPAPSRQAMKAAPEQYCLANARQLGGPAGSFEATMNGPLYEAVERDYYGIVP